MQWYVEFYQVPQPSNEPELYIGSMASNHWITLEVPGIPLPGDFRENAGSTYEPTWNSQRIIYVNFSGEWEPNSFTERTTFP